VHLPIPYAEHCKVTASQPNFYYHINYRTYADYTRVESFSMDLAQRHSADVGRAAVRLDTPEKSSIPDRGRWDQSYSFALVAGHAEMVEVRGWNRAVYEFTCRVSSEDLETALRGCLLTIAFDGEDKPSVQAPLGDFFGAAPGLNPYQSLPCGVREDGTMYAHWVMPLHRRAEIRFANKSNTFMRVEGSVVSAKHDWRRDSLHFHAKWRGQFDVHTQPRQDVNYVTAKGRGRFVGCMLHIKNPVPDWWGEGDEKIYVDGEAFPSTFGTGSEDYFGYAWGSPEYFTHAYHNQPRCDGPGTYGHDCVNRFHIIDDIPFTQSLQFDMELWHWREVDVDYATTSYWYARPGGSDNLREPDIKDLVVSDVPGIRGVEGALEGEEMPVLTVTQGSAVPQSSTGWGWSRFRQLWWTGAQPGGQLALGFPVERAGRYEVIAVFTKAVDYGIVRVGINKEPVDELFDLFNDGVVPTEPISLGVFDLRAGQNIFNAEIVGVNPKAQPSYMFGLDYLLLKPAQ
jgi:D-arabinan exo alpha-(1,3)/(1,5)-arabinofuranosidase (non-reducing end)